MENGKAEGHEESSSETARLMLADHEPIEIIVKYSGLTEKQVRELMK